MAPQISDDDRTAGEPVTGTKEMHYGCWTQMMSHLTRQDHVNTLVAEGRGAGAANHDCKTTPLRECGRGATQLEANGSDPDAPLAAPLLRDPGEIACAGAEIEQRNGLAEGRGTEGARQSISHRRGAAKPAVGSGDVPKRLGDRDRIGRRIVQQLDADGTDRELSQDYSMAAYPPR